METNAQSDNIHCTNFYRDGFVIIENVLSEEQKRVLHSECERLTNFVMDQGYDLMSELGGIIEPVNVGYEDPPETQTFVFNKRAYIRNRDKISTPDSLTNIIFGVVKDLVAKLLPNPTEDEPLCLFNEQYIVKMPRSVNESAFAWHQDNGTLLIEPLPFIINTEETISYIPQVSSYLEYFGLRADAYAPPLDTMEALDRSILSGTDGRQEEFVISSSDGSLQEEERPQSRYRTPVLVKIPAGSIVFLSGHVRHCSLGNPSPLFRRAYMPQYSIGTVFNGAGCLIALAVPCEDPAPLQVPPVFDDV
ncbi:hypothetical protein DFQ26_005224 [Actinomortierella ambigua]|nr:hypothetical protein DFQ26_005224 [Actinomortierella ambigua]